MMLKCSPLRELLAYTTLTLRWHILCSFFRHHAVIKGQNVATWVGGCEHTRQVGLLGAVGMVVGVGCGGESEGWVLCTHTPH